MLHNTKVIAPRGEKCRFKTLNFYKTTLVWPKLAFECYILNRMKTKGEPSLPIRRRRRKRRRREAVEDGSVDSSDSCSVASSECSNVESVSELSLSSQTNKGSTKCGNLPPIGLDCEMVGVGEGKSSALARCSIVNYDGNVLYDSYVKAYQEITDYRTQWSGIRPCHMAKAISFRKAKKQVKRLLKNRVVVGHALQFDLTALNLTHPSTLTRDTAKYVPLRSLAGLPSNSTPSLKRLTSQLFNSVIQENEHCSVEDARAAMKLYKLCEKRWEEHLQGKTPQSYLGDVFWPSWTKVKSEKTEV